MSGNMLRIEDEEAINRLEAYVRDGTFYLEIENEWAGDTETGFGRTCLINLDHEQATKLRDWLSFCLAQIPIQPE